MRPHCDKAQAAILRAAATIAAPLGARLVIEDAQLAVPELTAAL